MKRVCVCIIVCVFVGIWLAACSVTREAAPTPTIQRDTVIVVKYDTVVRSFPLFIFDTTASLAILRDSFTWDHPDGRTVLVVQKDTVWRYRIKTQIKADTLQLIRTDTIFREVVKEIEAPTGPPSGLPWWIVVLAVAIAVAGGYSVKKTQG